MRPTSPRDSGSNRDDQVNPTVRWLVHGAWKIAVGLVAILLVLNLIVELTD
jgi:hypothetical protein